MKQILSIKNDKDDIYSVYKTIFNTGLEVWRKNILLTSLVGGYPSSWKVIGVSESALEALNSYYLVQTPKLNVQRAHIVSRMDTAKELFKKKYSKYKFFKVFQNDYTILVAKGENKKNLNRTLQVIPIGLNENLFQCARIGFCWNKKEKDWLIATNKNYTLLELQVLIASLP